MGLSYTMRGWIAPDTVFPVTMIGVEYSTPSVFRREVSYTSEDIVLDRAAGTPMRHRLK